MNYQDIKNNPRVIHDAGGWHAHSAEMKELLGLDRKAKLPPEGMPARDVQGVRVFVLSIKEAKVLRLFHRVRAFCPDCGQHMSAGRLHQHVCK